MDKAGVLQVLPSLLTEKRRAALRYGLRFAPAYSGTAFFRLGRIWRAFKLVLIGLALGDPRQGLRQKSGADHARRSSQ